MISSAQYGERGGASALRATSTTERNRQPHHQPLDSRQVTFKDDNQSSRNRNLTSANTSSNSQLQNSLGKQPLSSTSKDDSSDNTSADTFPRSALLRDDVFPDWTDSPGDEGSETPEEMQKKDPLGTQIWKLYSRTKTRLPNQERMENLTWRMMAMNLRRRELESRAMYAISSC